MNKNAGPYGSFTGFAEMVKNRKGKDTVSDIANFVGESLEYKLLITKLAVMKVYLGYLRYSKHNLLGLKGYMLSTLRLQLSLIPQIGSGLVKAQQKQN